MPPRGTGHAIRKIRAPHPSLYQVCWIEAQPGIPIVYDFIVDAKLDYQIWFHFAEIDPTVINSGLRVFNACFHQWANSLALVGSIPASWS